MKPRIHHPRKSNQAGVALLIALFMLILVSAVAISLMMSSGTESSLASNYRSSTTAYYAAYAGIEEARGRLLPSNSNYVGTAFMPTAGLPLGQVRYITNPLPGEVVAPTTAGNAYYDTEYQREWGVAVPAANTLTIPSVSTVAGIQGPMYKWVRITAATEQSINVDVNNQAAPLDNAIPLFYDSAHLNAGGGADPSLIVNAAPPNTANQVYEITSLAVLPNGTKKTLQYVVTPVTYNLNFPSALSLPGANVAFNPASSNQWYANGQDGSGNGNNSSWAAVPGCTPNAATTLPAIGVTGAANVTAVKGSISRPTHYTGGGLGTPSVGNVGLNPTLSTPAALNDLVSQISQNANAVLNPPSGTSANFSQLPASMSATNPATVVVNGDFSLGPNTGYGLLVVTGTFTYSGNSGWDGVILVIGSGTAQFLGNGGGNGGFNGAIFVATTKDAAGNTLPTLGNVDFDINGGGGNGIYYDSCWVKNVQKPPTFQVLSYREISN